MLKSAIRNANVRISGVSPRLKCEERPPPRPLRPLTIPSPALSFSVAVAGSFERAVTSIVSFNIPGKSG